MKKCPNCGQQNTDDKQRCYACLAWLSGPSLEPVKYEFCPVCGKQWLPCTPTELNTPENVAKLSTLEPARSVERFRQDLVMLLVPLVAGRFPGLGSFSGNKELNETIAETVVTLADAVMQKLSRK